MSIITHLELGHEFRPVDWRWERARARRGPDARDDRRVREFLAGEAQTDVLERFQVAVESCRNLGDQLDIQMRFPRLMSAYKIWVGARTRNNDPEERTGSQTRETNYFRRYEIEARLLSGQTHSEIAVSMGLREKTVMWYESAFYHVSDKRTDRSWVAHQAISPSVYSGLRDRDLDSIWKISGYNCGPIVVELFATHGTAPDAVAIVGAILDDHTHMEMRKARYKAVLTLNASDPYVKMQYFDVVNKFEDIRQKLRSGASQDTLATMIEQMLVETPWGVADKDPENSKNPRRSRLIGAVEPRSRDLVALTVGGAVLTIPSSTFPEEHAP